MREEAWEAWDVTLGEGCNAKNWKWKLTMCIPGNINTFSSSSRKTSRCTTMS